MCHGNLTLGSAGWPEGVLHPSKVKGVGVELNLILSGLISIPALSLICILSSTFSLIKIHFRV